MSPRRPAMSTLLIQVKALVDGVQEIGEVVIAGGVGLGAQADDEEFLLFGLIEDNEVVVLAQGTGFDAFDVFVVIVLFFWIEKFVGVPPGFGGSVGQLDLIVCLADNVSEPVLFQEEVTDSLEVVGGGGSLEVIAAGVEEEGVRPALLLNMIIEVIHEETDPVISTLSIRVVEPTDIVGQDISRIVAGRDQHGGEEILQGVDFSSLKMGGGRSLFDMSQWAFFHLNFGIQVGKAAGVFDGKELCQAGRMLLLILGLGGVDLAIGPVDQDHGLGIVGLFGIEVPPIEPGADLILQPPETPRLDGIKK